MWSCWRWGKEAFHRSATGGFVPVMGAPILTLTARIQPWAKLFFFFYSDSSDRQGGQIHFIAYAKPRHPSCCTEPRNRFWLDTCTLLFELSSLDLAELWRSRLIHSNLDFVWWSFRTFRAIPPPKLSSRRRLSLDSLTLYHILLGISHLHHASRHSPKSLALKPRFYLDRAANIDKASISTRANSLRVA